MPFTLEDELAEQSRWRLLPKFRGHSIFEQTASIEFMPPDRQREFQWKKLQRVLRFAEENVPFYEELFKSSGIRSQDFRGPNDLTTLPLLSRETVQARGDDLRAVRLPRGHSSIVVFQTSGSTGQPVKVLRTTHSVGIAVLLKSREYRWARADLRGTLAVIRPKRDLPMDTDGKQLKDGETFVGKSWFSVGSHFYTGPSLGFGHSNPLPEQVAWLEKHQPTYLRAQSADLEHLSLAFQDRAPLKNLRGLYAFSQDVTPEMRRRIEQVFGVPLFQNYGLIEIGLVAVRCNEGERYHVHGEHCLVEIVDDQGQACPPGEVGHILVTGLNNMAMPLVRYDTGDLATAASGPCPCGRTLPSFGPIKGRYRRIAFLPPGTWDYWMAFQRTLEDMPQALATPLRQYQLHQFKDGGFELRIIADGGFAPEFDAFIQERWQGTKAGETLPLRIVRVDRLARPPVGNSRTFPPTSHPIPAPKTPRGDKTRHDRWNGEMSALGGDLN